MKNKNWLMKAVVLGTVFFLAALIIKPVGVSTQFSVLSGMIHSVIDQDVITEDQDSTSGYQSTNAYYAKSDAKLAKEIKNPINYDFIFVLAIPLGAFVAYILTGDRKKHKQLKNMTQQDMIQQNMKQQNMKQQNITQQDIKQQTPETSTSKGWRYTDYVPAFIGGFLLLFGARMADGCTSGHMMSGMMQGSVSGYLFAAAVFAVAIPTAIIIGNRKKGGQ